MKSLQVFHDNNSITGITGICDNGLKTGCAGSCSDSLNPEVVSVNDKKVILGYRPYNKNGADKSDIYHQNSDKSVIGLPYDNKNSDEIPMFDYIHEINEYQGDNKKMVGTERELFYINNKEILTCPDTDDQKIIGFQGNIVPGSNDTAEKSEVTSLGFICDKIPIVKDVPVTTQPRISNVVKPGYSTYHIRDQNNNYIGIEKNDNYNIIISNQKPNNNDHRFKFIIRYKKQSDSIYHILSVKHLVEDGDNIVLTTSNVDSDIANDSFKYKIQLDEDTDYNIHSLIDEDERNDPNNFKTFHIGRTFQIDLDNNYCSIIDNNFNCNRPSKDLIHKFSLEVTTEVPIPRKTRPSRTIIPKKAITKSIRFNLWGSDSRKLDNILNNQDRLTQTQSRLNNYYNSINL